MGRVECVEVRGVECVDGLRVVGVDALRYVVLPGFDGALLDLVDMREDEATFGFPPFWVDGAVSVAACLEGAQVNAAICTPI